MTKKEQDELNQKLINASKSNNLEQVKSLIKQGADIHVALKYAKESPQENDDVNKLIDWCEKYIDRQELNDKLESNLSANTDKINKKKVKV